ncbi:MAG: hypothetical protein IJ228_01730 [Succinivibrio sp.]|nr:hypothetical protein [Succinivibrio sp.]
MNKLTDDKVLRSLLPRSIGGVETVDNAASAIEPQLQNVALKVPLLFLWLRLLKTAGMQLPEIGAPFKEVLESQGLEVLDTAILEQLAKQFHLDFREAAENDTQLAGLIANSIAWHRIKGTPASIKAALELCGFRGIYIEEDGDGDLWATYQLGLEGVRSIDDIKRIVAICNEMQPARCRLWRVYTTTGAQTGSGGGSGGSSGGGSGEGSEPIPGTGDFDLRPGIWSGGQTWSNALWSDVTGVKNTGIRGQDDNHDLVIALGVKNGYQSESFFKEGADAHAGTAFEETRGVIAEYRDKMVWSDYCWSDVPAPIDNPFVISELSVFVLGRGEPFKPLPKWMMNIISYSKAMGIWSDGETWSDINSVWSAGYADIYDPPLWSDGTNWSEGPIAEHIWIDEYFLESYRVSTSPINHLAGVGFESLHGFKLPDDAVCHTPYVTRYDLYCAQSWPGSVEQIMRDFVWSRDVWSEAMTLTDKLIPRPDPSSAWWNRNAYQMAQYEPKDWYCFGSALYATMTQPPRNNSWWGSPEDRTWNEYQGQTLVTYTFATTLRERAALKTSVQTGFAADMVLTAEREQKRAQTLILGITSLQSAALHNNSWYGSPEGRTWNDYRLQTVITSEEQS